MNFFRKMATFVAVILCLSCIKVNIFAATVLKNETVYLPLGAEYAYDTTHLINYDDFDENLSIDEGNVGIKKYGYIDGQWIFTADKVGKEIVEFSYNNFSVMETLTIYIYQPITSININNTASIVGRDVYVPFSFNENADSTYYNLYASIYTGADNNYKGYEDFSAQSNVELVRLDNNEIVLCAKKPGQYKIKLSATDTNAVKDPITSIFTLTATQPITSISIKPASINTIMGEYENT